MKYVIFVSTALLLAVGQQEVRAQSAPLDLVKQSVEALGGANALRATKTLVVKADVKHWEPGQQRRVTFPRRLHGHHIG